MGRTSAAEMKSVKHQDGKGSENKHSDSDNDHDDSEDRTGFMDFEYEQDIQSKSNDKEHVR